MTFIYLWGHFILPGITPGYHISMHAKNQVPRPFGLAVIDKCHVCDGHTDTQTDTQTENRHKLFLSLTFIDMTHINILFLRHLVKILHTDRQRKYILWYTEDSQDTSRWLTNDFSKVETNKAFFRIINTPLSRDASWGCTMPQFIVASGYNT